MADSAAQNQLNEVHMTVAQKDKWRNPVWARLEAGDLVIGMTVTTSNIESAAHAATLGFHFLWVEMEHSPLTLEALRGIVLSTRGLPAMVFARVPVVELWTAKRVLDQGVTGVIFPFTSTPELAQTAAWSCRYPPIGRRGSGAGLATGCWPEPGSYYDSADSNIMAIAVIEEARAVENIDAIASTPGIDVLFIGTSDLSFSLGLRGRQDESALENAIATIVAAGQKHGKFLGRPAGTPEQVLRYREQGFQFFQSRTELGLMSLGAKQLLEPLSISGVPSDSRSLY
jgi:2-keto-3-deoxy-L-rhamnonate aldolase RhmA